MKHIYLALILIFIAMPVQAEPLAKGGNIPTLGALTNQDGEELKLYDLYGKKGMTLVFYRSAGWCPYCQKQLIELNKSASEFEKAGYPLVGLSYDKAAILKKFDTKHDISFPLLSDPASEAIRAFGIMDESYAKGTFAYGVPKPAIYIISNKGKVEKIFKEASYKNRPVVSTILKEIKPVPVVNLGEEFPDDPNVIDGEIEVMEATPELITAPASDAAVEAAAEINEATMEKTLEDMDMAPVIEEKAPEITIPEMNVPKATLDGAAE